MNKGSGNKCSKQKEFWTCLLQLFCSKLKSRSCSNGLQYKHFCKWKMKSWKLYETASCNCIVLVVAFSIIALFPQYFSVHFLWMKKGRKCEKHWNSYRCVWKFTGKLTIAQWQLDTWNDGAGWQLGDSSGISLQSEVHRCLSVPAVLHFPTQAFHRCVIETNRASNELCVAGMNDNETQHTRSFLTSHKMRTGTQWEERRSFLAQLCLIRCNRSSKTVCREPSWNEDEEISGVIKAVSGSVREQEEKVKWKQSQSRPN